MRYDMLSLDETLSGQRVKGEGRGEPAERERIKMGMTAVAVHSM